MLYTLFAQLNGMTLNVPADRIVAMRVPGALVDEVAARVAAVPGVAATTVSSGMLGRGARERVETADSTPGVISRLPVGEGFLDTLGLALLRGRTFDRAEIAAHAAVGILTESGERQLAPHGNAVGLRVRTARHGEVIVVGVCRDPIDYGAMARLDGNAGELYVPFEPSVAGDAVVLARTSGDARGTLRAIAAAAQLPRGARPARPAVLDDEFQERLRITGGTRAVVRILLAFAVLTLLLAAVGVFAVVSQSVAQRTREFGIRLAIGATARGVLGMVLAREARLTGLAVGVGLAFAMGLTRALFVELTRLGAIVPSFWVGALLLSGSVAALAVALATVRILRLEPGEVLRRT